MKKQIFAIIGVALALGLTSALAQPPGKGSQFRKSKPLRTVEDFSNVKQGDKLSLVCLQCKSVSELTTSDASDAMEYCVQDGRITCPSCSKSYKTVVTGPPGKEHRRQQVTFVNDAGEECVFMTRATPADREAGASE